MEINKIWNADCIEAMADVMDEHSVDIVLTSPPYNTARNGCDFFNDTKKRRYTTRYVDFNDYRTSEEYSDWTIKVFNGFDRVLKKNGVVLYNISYGVHTHESFWNLIADIQNNTAFTVADCIIWKKKCAVPNCASPNKLTRICEFVFVFCRKDEYNSFTANKKVVSLSKGTNQKNYENVMNFVEAKNNDGKNDLHKATYSTELCEKLLSIYGKEGMLVFDPFMGTGTTALAAIKLGMDYVGCEIFTQYYDMCEKRIKEFIDGTDN